MNFSTIIYLFLLCLGIKYSQAGKVTAIGRTPILISSNNINEISSYTFTFVLDTPAQSGDLLFIKFPESQYSHFSSLANTACSAYLHAESFIAKTTLDCTLDSDLEFVITLPELNNGAYNPHSVTIQGLKNPAAVGGSGNFAVKTCRGSAANPLDVNNAFTQVGIVAAPSSFSSAVVSITTNSGINQNGTYKIDLVTTKIIPMKGYIKIIFPAASNIYEDFVCTPTVTADNCTRVDAQTIVLSNFSADIPVGSVSITLTKILNIPYVGSAGSLKIQTWTNSINTILEQRTLAVPTTVAGTISGSPTAYYTNFQTSGQTLVSKDSLYYEISFRTVNPVPSTGTVQLTVPTGMTLTSCVAYSGFDDISEASPATCTAASGVATVKSFSPLAANQLLTIAFLATNPTATGLTASVSIKSFYDSLSTQLIDQLTTGFTFTMSSTLTTMKSLGLTLSTYAATSTAVWTFNWQSAVALTSSTAATVGIFQITIPTGFSFSGTPTCQLKTAAAGSPTTVPCTLSGGVLSLTTASMPGGTTFSNSADNTLIVTGSSGGLVNARAGDYQVIFQLQEGGTLARRQSIILKTTAATTLGASIAQLTRDRTKYTLYDISFTAPENINPGIHPASSGSAQSKIRLTFQTASGTTVLFPLALGRENDTTTGSTIPCYGINGLKPFTTGGKLRCVIYFATSASSTTPAIIDVFDFASVTSGTLVTLQLPKIQNPDSMTTAADISVSLIYTQNHITRTYFTSTVSQTASLLDAVVGSGNNTNGVSGAPTNLAPTFNPSTINKVSRAEVKFTPGSGRSLAVGSKIIMKFPLLPTTSPMSFVFTSSTYCSIGLTVAQPCLVYPEVGWIVIKNLVQAFTAGQEYSIMIFNIQNPPFAGALNGALNIITISTNREFEEFKYTSFSSFSTGGLSNINVFPSSYEANAVDVEYNWIFVTSNTIPAGGSIQLTFPPNTYSLDSDPPVTAEVITGLSPASATSPIKYTFVINVATVKNFAAVPAGTLIRVVTKGVKNPIEATRTTNFAILTLNAAGYTIDSNTLITGLNILTANPTGVIVFNYFYTTPSNGNMKGNYYLSFYPQTSYPKGTTITILFPSTEFDATDYYDETCFISGALTTLESCTLDKTINTFTIITDQKLEIEPGMLPINIYFPHIKNFNEELSSGVVTVRAVYDSVILDDSGNAEDNRKATTSNGAAALTTSSFSIVPSTEGQSATYTVTLKPLVSFNTKAVIQFEFPEEFTAGLGETINCKVPALEISADIPVQCVVDERKINITKLNSYDATTGTGFTVSISGIVNPNRLPAVTGTIAVFILTSETVVSEFTLSIGTLSFTAAPQILDVTAFTSSNVLTRKLANYDFTLSPTMNIATPSTLTAEYSSEYSTGTFSKSPTIAIGGAAAVATTITGNSILKALSAAITSGSSFALSLVNIANPLDSGEKRYPTVYIQDDTANTVTVRTYDNLIKPLNLIYSHGGEIVTINDDQATTIYPGQANKYYFKFQSPTTQALTIKALPLSASLVDVSDITVPVGATQASIWIGVPSSATPETVYIEWEIVGDTLNRFWVIRPLAVNIVEGQTEVFVDEVVYVPAGGRTRPCYVTLSNSPLNDLEIQLYQRGSIPTYVNVYPSKLVFTKGELTKPFWVSSGTDTRGISGSVLFLINGTNKDAYFMPKRLRSFIISRGDTSIPYLLRNKLAAVGENYITVNASTSEASTILYFIAPRGTPAPVFEDIKDKKIRYDYYAGEYVVGEYVNDTSSYNYTFNVTGLKPGMDYDSYFYIEDFSGNQGNASFSYQFSTSQDYPQQVYLNVLQASMTAADTTKLLEAIVSATGLRLERLETDMTVLGSRGSGDTSTRAANTSSLNKRVKYSGSSSSVPSVVSGTRATFIVFPDVNDPFAPSCSQAVALIKSKLATININYGGTSASPLIGTAYGVNNQQVEPDDIRWGSGMTLTVAKSYTTITISGIKLNAAGTVYASAYTTTTPRKLYYSTQDSVTAAIRYLQQTPSESSSYTGPGRRLANLYGQQSCVISSANELVVGCDGNDLPAEDISRSDYDYSYVSSVPSSYQVSRQADSWYFKGDSVASIDFGASGGNGTITLTGLTEGTTYTVNLVATDGYSKYPIRMLDKYVISQQVTTDIHIVKSVDASILSVSLASILLGLSMMLFI